MPKRVPPLNAKQIEKWRPDPARTLEMVDGAVPGLRVQLSPFGDLTWSLSAYVHGVRRRIAVGKGLRLAEARRKAEQMRAEIASGVDPTATRKAHVERHRAAAKGVGTFGSVITAYYEGPGAHLRTGHEMRLMLERVFKPHLPSPSLDVRAADVQRTIDHYPSKSSAQHAAIYFRQVARWAAKRDLLLKMEPLETPRVLVQRHKLTHEQAGKLWRELGWTRHALAARFMLLTATRREEVCGATWREFDLEARTWTIPAVRRKNPRPDGPHAQQPHVVPLSRQCVKLLELVLHSGKQDGELVFVGQRAAKLLNWPRWSARVAQQLGFEVTPHALRRTCATLAGDLGQPPHVVSALLGHRVGTALHSGYNQSKYTAEVADALQRVADMLEELAGGSYPRE
ncbi:MAG TPA: tyrosine-type recombinase/integrase [Roseiarcus sp.]|jgi:integrase|nr:tyrosine-type recombinase/integrase [Roseiarcus sp.]